MPGKRQGQRRKRKTYRGLQGHIRQARLPRVDTWRNEFPDRDYIIQMTIPEFTCVCPKTGLPDFATLNLRYVPNRLCLELKSLKMYLLAYRSLGIFHEHAVNRIVDDLWASCRPRALSLTGIFNSRGGITTQVTASRGSLDLLATASSAIQGAAPEPSSP